MYDMLVKSSAKKEHVGDLWETFEVLQKYRMRLNPTKCAFGVASWCPREGLRPIQKIKEPYLICAPKNSLSKY